MIRTRPTERHFVSSSRTMPVIPRSGPRMPLNRAPVRRTVQTLARHLAATYDDYVAETARRVAPLISEYGVPISPAIQPVNRRAALPNYLARSVFPLYVGKEPVVAALLITSAQYGEGAFYAVATTLTRLRGSPYAQQVARTADEALVAAQDSLEARLAHARTP